MLTRPNRAGGEDDHLWPEILPGGQAVLFTITATTGGLDQAQIAVLDLRTGTQTVLIRGGSDARYVSSGRFGLRCGGDAARRRLRPRPARCRRHAGDGPARGADDPSGAAGVAVAADGTLVYVSGGVSAVGAEPGVGGPAGPGDADTRTAA